MHFSAYVVYICDLFRTHSSIPDSRVLLPARALSRASRRSAVRGVDVLQAGGLYSVPSMQRE